MTIKNVKLSYNIKGLEQLNVNLKQQLAVKVGVLGAKTNRTDGKTTNASIGALHEFGSFSNNLPARSWLKMPLEYKQEQIISKAAQVISNDILKQNGITMIFGKVGAICEAAIFEAFETGGFGQWQSLTVNTVRTKNGNDKILIDTAQLKNSVSSEVVKI